MSFELDLKDKFASLAWFVFWVFESKDSANLCSVIYHKSCPSGGEDNRAPVSIGFEGDYKATDQSSTYSYFFEVVLSLFLILLWLLVG